MSSLDADNANLPLVEAMKHVLSVQLLDGDKLRREDFVAFGEKCLKFDVFFASLMIIPTRHDEKRVVAQLMAHSEMALGSSWFILSKEWWDGWCRYTGFNEDEQTTENVSDNISDTTSDAMGHGALRPIAISNRSLLDDECYFFVLKEGLEENNHFIVIPQGAWSQLSEWYG